MMPKEGEMATVAVTDDTFDTEVKASDLPVVVDFWAEWCGPCKQIGPALEELSAEMEGMSSYRSTLVMTL